MINIRLQISVKITYCFAKLKLLGTSQSYKNKTVYCFAIVTAFVNITFVCLVHFVLLSVIWNLLQVFILKYLLRFSVIKLQMWFGIQTG